MFCLIDEKYIMFIANDKPIFIIFYLPSHLKSTNPPHPAANIADIKWKIKQKRKKNQVKNIQRICIEVEKGSDTSKLNYPLDFLAEIFLSDFDTWGFFFTGEYFIKIHDVAIYDGVVSLDLIRQMSMCFRDAHRQIPVLTRRACCFLFHHNSLQFIFKQAFHSDWNWQ